VGRNIPVQQFGGLGEFFFLNNQNVPTGAYQKSSWNRAVNFLFPGLTCSDDQRINWFVFVAGVLKIKGSGLKLYRPAPTVTGIGYDVGRYARGGAESLGT